LPFLVYKNFCNEIGTATKTIMPLTGKQKRRGRGRGHELNPVVLIGQQGLDERIIAAIKNAVDTHELVKIKLLESFSGDRHETAEELAAKTQTELVQVLGKTILLYKMSVEKPNIQLLQ